MDPSHIPQGLATASPPSSSSARSPHPPSQAMERRRPPRPRKEQPLSCPRCNSTNTKFCYYNNYSLSQPRHLCKACKRYWTDGGSLRNVPIGGGSRKNKRAAPSSLPPPSTPKRLLLTDPMAPPTQNPNPSFHEGHGLANLGGPFHAGVPPSPFMAVPGIGGYGENMQDGGSGRDCYGLCINEVMGGGGGRRELSNLTLFCPHGWWLGG